MLICHKGHTDTIQVYSVTVMTHVKALQARHSSQGTSEPITPGHTTRWAGSLSRRFTGASTKKADVLLLSDTVNCRNYEYYTVCDISMCCMVDLTMYSNVYADCVVNPRRDKCWIVL